MSQLETIFAPNDERRPVVGTQDPTAIEPPDDWMLVKVDPKQEKEGTIHLPEVAQAIPRSGVIISQGEGTLLEDGKSRAKMHAAKGNRVLFEPAAGKRIPGLPGYLLMRNGSICSIIHGEEVLTPKNVVKNLAPVSDFLLLATDRADEFLSRRANLRVPRHYAQERHVEEQHELCLSGRVLKRGPGLLTHNGQDRAPKIALVGQRVLVFEPGLWWSVPGVDGCFLAPERGCVPGVMVK